MGRRKTKNPDDYKKLEIEIPVDAYCKLAEEAAKAKKSKNDLLASLIGKSKSPATPVKTKIVQFNLPVVTDDILKAASLSAQKTKVEFLTHLINQHQAIGDHYQNLDYLHKKQREANSMHNEIAILKGAMVELGQLNKEVLQILRKEV